MSLYLYIYNQVAIFNYIKLSLLPFMIVIISFQFHIDSLFHH